jgi:hypothetical protein
VEGDWKWRREVMKITTFSSLIEEALVAAARQLGARADLAPLSLVGVDGVVDSSGHGAPG